MNETVDDTQAMNGRGSLGLLQPFHFEQPNLLYFYQTFSAIAVFVVMLVTPTGLLQNIYILATIALIAILVLRQKRLLPDAFSGLSFVFIVSILIVSSSFTFGGAASVVHLLYLAVLLPVLAVLGPRTLAYYLAFVVVSVLWANYKQSQMGMPTSPEPGVHMGWALANLATIAWSLIAHPAVAQIYLMETFKLIKVRNRELLSTQANLLEQQKQHDAFVASISHELRTPMHGIMGFLQTSALKGSVTSHNQQMFDAMQYSAKHLMTVINDLLDFSLIQTGNLRVVERPMNLKQLLQEVGHMFEMRMEEKGVRLRIKIDGNVPEWVIGDSDRLAQILINLLGNAAKFTTQGYVELCAHYDAKNVLEVSVEDTGCGIEKSQMSAVFDRFSSITESTRREYGGTGLGLSITQNLIGLMRGEIGATSLINVGSTFWFKVPLVAIAPPSLPQDTDNQHAQNGPIVGRVLIVDDSSVNRIVARQMLSSELPGVSTDEVDGGIAALEILEHQAFDLVLMDVIMPDLDGMEATRRIMAKPKPPVVIGLTADVTKAVQQGCADAGMHRVILKPYDKATLIEAVSAVLQPAPQTK